VKPPGRSPGGPACALIRNAPRGHDPAHQTGDLAELVCSNSLGSYLETTGGGLLKRELEIMGSVIMNAAAKTGFPRAVLWPWTGSSLPRK